jgi:hypothetical protein
MKQQAFFASCLEYWRFSRFLLTREEVKKEVKIDANGKIRVRAASVLEQFNKFLRFDHLRRRMKIRNANLNLRKVRSPKAVRRPSKVPVE